jgi:hypothetical protein
VAVAGGCKGKARRTKEKEEEAFTLARQNRVDSKHCTGSARRIYTLLILRLSAVVFVVFASNFWQRGKRLLSIIWYISQLSYQLHLHYGCDKEVTPRFNPRARLACPLSNARSAGRKASARHCGLARGRRNLKGPEKKMGLAHYCIIKGLKPLDTRGFFDSGTQNALNQNFKKKITFFFVRKQRLRIIQPSPALLEPKLSERAALCGHFITNSTVGNCRNPGVQAP